MRAPRVMFTGGGTGGHIFPALAIADELKSLRPEGAIAFIGTKTKIEARVVPQAGYQFFPITVSALRRRISVETALFPLHLLAGMGQSLARLRQWKPDVVVGTGGYVSGPPLYAASVMGIPTLLHESNSIPGATTRLLAGRMSEVHITFAGTKDLLRRKDNVVLSGNPTRGSLGTLSREDGAAHFGLHPDNETLFAFGGSLGAQSINAALLGLVPRLAGRGVQVIWQTGLREHETFRQGASAFPGVVVLPFIDRMDCAYAAADLVVCRAGATTLAEITRLGMPSILVPYPHAAADHQTANAQALVDAHAAVMVRDADLASRLGGVVDALLGDVDRRNSMAARCRSLGRPDAARTLAEAVLRLGGFT